MLGKLLKYDNIEMAHTFVPLYIVIVALAIINSVFINTKWIFGIIGGSTIIVALFIALAVVSLVMIINQFYKNILGDQGYLTNTLPVSVDSIICSKLFCAMIWMALSIVVSIITAFVLVMSFVSISDITNVWAIVVPALQETWTELNASFGVVGTIIGAVLLILNSVAGIAQEILHLYFSMTCTQLGICSKNRIASAFIIYVVSNIVLAIITGAGMTAGAFFYDKLTMVMSEGAIGLLGIFATLIFMSALNAAFYFSTRYILKNKLNLE